MPDLPVHALTEGIQPMKAASIVLFALLLPCAASADHHLGPKAAVADAIKAFNTAYADGDIPTYFSYYADDSMVYFYGARQDLAAYREEWTELLNAGGAVEKNDVSDLRIQVMPRGDVAVATYFVDYQLREPDGEVTAAKAFESEVWQKRAGKWKIVNLHYSEIRDDD